MTEEAGHGARAAFALLPADADLVIGADLDKLRALPGWTAVLSALVRSTKSPIDRIAARTGLDLIHNVHMIVVALPAERQSDDRFVIVAEAEPLDERRLLEGVTAQFGGKVSAEIRRHRQVILRSGAWAERSASVRTLAPHSETRRLCERAEAGQALWFAAIVPNTIRRKQMQNPRFADVASIARVSGQLDIHNGLAVDVAAETMTVADATDLVHRLNVYLNQMKHHPDMLVLGLAPALDMLRLSVDGATVHLHLDVPAAQLVPYVEKLESLARMLGTK